MGGRLRLCPSFAPYLLVEENDRGEDPNDVAVVDALLTGEALVSSEDACPDELILLGLPIVIGVVSMNGTAGRVRAP